MSRGWLSTGRREPYTDAGIRRVPCVRCGDPGATQWQVCADQSRYRAMCLACDIALNEVVLKWANDPQWELKMNWYRAKADA
jgi:hypothetical protein